MAAGTVDIYSRCIHINLSIYIKHLFNISEESKQAARIFSEQSASVGEAVSRLERQLHERVAAAAPRDLIALERCAREHADWEGRARALASDIEAVQDTFRGFYFVFYQVKNF